jgi:hypothetical protein
MTALYSPHIRKKAHAQGFLLHDRIFELLHPTFEGDNRIEKLQNSSFETRRRIPKRLDPIKTIRNCAKPI